MMDGPTPATNPTTPPAASPRPLGKIVFVCALLAAGLTLIAWTAVRHFRPARDPEDNVGQQALDHLKKHKVPLSGSLETLLKDTKRAPEKFLVLTQDHPLLAQQAPDFALSAVDGKTWKLSERLKDGPVIVVFYFGYHCNHCVRQLFDVNEDVRYFQELGAQLVAVSADAPESTRERLRQFGKFQFPVLSDPDNKVAQSYRVYSPGDGKKEATLLHGTFVIGTDGLVQWANVGDEPFTGNRTLLFQVAKLEGRLSAGP
ncbi:MAG: peroxiredoxin family protein [Gemmataceae bacterium]|nr:peroxiredoxin family protein [Gemmataceae bacterium]